MHTDTSRVIGLIATVYKNSVHDSLNECTQTQAESSDSSDSSLPFSKTYANPSCFRYAILVVNAQEKINSITHVDHHIVESKEDTDKSDKSEPENAQVSLMKIIACPAPTTAVCTPALTCHRRNSHLHHCTALHPPPQSPDHLLRHRTALHCNATLIFHHNPHLHHRTALHCDAHTTATLIFTTALHCKSPLQLPFLTHRLLHPHVSQDIGVPSNKSGATTILLNDMGGGSKSSTLESQSSRGGAGSEDTKIIGRSSHACTEI
jgi:hypothetical protein